jgi:hypothetical protein
MNESKQLGDDIRLLVERSATLRERSRRLLRYNRGLDYWIRSAEWRWYAAQARAQRLGCLTKARDCE